MKVSDKGRRRGERGVNETNHCNGLRYRVEHGHEDSDIGRCSCTDRKTPAGADGLRDDFCDGEEGERFERGESRASGSEGLTAEDDLKTSDDEGSVSLLAEKA